MNVHELVGRITEANYRTEKLLRLRDKDDAVELGLLNVAHVHELLRELKETLATESYERTLKNMQVSIELIGTSPESMRRKGKTV
jgi:predicted ATP-dependent protease